MRLMTTMQHTREMHHEVANRDFAIVKLQNVIQ